MRLLETEPPAVPRRHKLSRKGAVMPLSGQLAWWQARALPRTDGRRAEQSPEHLAGGQWLVPSD